MMDVVGPLTAAAVSLPVRTEVEKIIRIAAFRIDSVTEVCFEYGFNWAGPLLAPEGGYSIREMVEAFHKLGF